MIIRTYDLRTILQKNRSGILRIAQQHGASNVRVFGSVARGENTEHSDIDFLVTFTEDYTLRQHLRLIADLHTLLNHRVDVANEATLRDEFRQTILDEAVAL